jgi:peptidoglycan-associated lipoprotein
MRQLRNVLVLMLLAAVVTGCPKKKSADVETTPETAVPDRGPSTVPSTPPREEVEPERFPTEPPVRDNDLPANASAGLDTVYFQFDSSELTPEAQATLRENATWLKGNSSVDIVVGGHCDERGTIEYNIALGERRANTVREYLTSLGVPRDRIRIVSYGEERPAEAGHSETAWMKNRRAEFTAE